MHNSYKDIIDRIKEEPKWWDDNAVPRYCDFHPRHSPNIYANQVILLRIACQGCGKQFKVERNWSPFHQMHTMNGTSFDQRLDNIYFGDPPNAGCCPVGPTMSSISLHIDEFWERESYDWKRLTQFERLPIESLTSYFELDSDAVLEYIEEFKAKP